MSRAVCQLALDRIIAYVRGCGVELTPEICRKALQLVDRALAEASNGEVMELAMNMVPEYFDLPRIHVPQQHPALKRGSIGYSPYV